MGFLSGNNKKKSVGRKPYHKPTDEELEKKEARKEKQLAREKLLTHVKDNPELERKWISKLMGIEIEPPDPVEAKKKDIKARLVEEAFTQINQDPELRRQYAEKLIGEIVGEIPGEGRYEGGYESPGSAIMQALEELENVEEFRDRLGIKPREGGILKSIVTEENVNEFIKLLRGLAVKTPIEESTVVVSVDGQIRRISESQFKQLEQTGRVSPVTAIQSLRVEPPKLEKVEPPKPELPKAEPEIPEFVLSNLETLASYLELTPEEFVEELSTMKDAEPTYQLLWTYLSATTPEAVVKLIEPYSKHSQVGIYVEKLLTDEGKEWVKQVISIIKEKK